MVNVALPRIGRELPSSVFGVLEGQSYVSNGYLVTLSALLVLAGALNDYYGRRRTFVVGLVGFLVTSLLCGIAPSMELLIVFRVLQGAAGALLVPGSLALLTATFSGEAQGRAFGLWAGASAATTILGPFLGGALVDTVSWRVAFLINVPLCVLAVWATLAFVRESREYLTRRFEGDFEIGALTGNFSELDGKPYLHCHAVIGARDFAAFTGHLTRGIVSVTCEIQVITDSGVLRRARRDDLGFHPLSLGR
jgi:MFS family permease